MRTKWLTRLICFALLAGLSVTMCGCDALAEMDLFSRFGFGEQEYVDADEEEDDPEDEDASDPGDDNEEDQQKDQDTSDDTAAKDDETANEDDTQGKQPELRENLVESFNAEQQRAANIFFSNFSEQNFPAYPAAGDLKLLEFAFVYCMINDPARIEYLQNGQSRISKDSVDYVLQRFFSRTIIHRSLLQENNISFEYQGGYYYTPSFSRTVLCVGFTVVHEMYRNEDGTYDVVFTNYHRVIQDGNNEVCNDEVAQFYGLTPEQAAQNPEVRPLKTGRAVVRDYTKSNGQASYQLIEMSLDP